MNEPHMIQTCPECGRRDIYWRSWKKNYRCFACHAVFEKPVEREAKRRGRNREPAITAEKRERYQAREQKRKLREAHYRDARPTRMAARWEQKIAEAKARWHEKYGDMPSQSIP